MKEKSFIQETQSVQHRPDSSLRDGHTSEPGWSANREVDDLDIEKGSRDSKWGQRKKEKKIRDSNRTDQCSGWEKFKTAKRKEYYKLQGGELRDLAVQETRKMAERMRSICRCFWSRGSVGRVCDVDSVVIRGEYHGFRYQGHYRCASFSAL